MWWRRRSEEEEIKRKKRGGKVGGGCGVGCGEGGGGACRLQNRMQDEDLTLQFWISRGKRPIRGVARRRAGGKSPLALSWKGRQ